MGKNLIQQRRGKGSIFASLKHQQKGKAKHPNTNCVKEGIIKELTTNKIHSAPLMLVQFGKESHYLIAPEGVKVGETISYSEEDIKPGNATTLENIPEGTLIYNIERNEGDGGKFARAGGTFARIVEKTEKGILVILPSKASKLFPANARANIGTVAGGGRKEKPFFKAGNKFKRMRAHHKVYPKVCGISMNAVAHPFGGKSSKIKGRPSTISRHAPPGRKVGKIAARRTGFKR